MGHITESQRYTIEVMHKAGHKQVEIANTIGRDKSVVSREINRNCDGRSGDYRSDLAQRKYRKRQKEKPKHKRFTSEVQKDVEELISQDYSPEQAVETLKKQGKPSVSTERVYQHIWQDKKKGGTLHTHLRHQGRRYRKRGNQKDNRGIIKNRIDIDKRPKIVEERSRFGDLEVDLIIGKNHKQAIVTINDRASGMLKMRKVESKKADIVSRAIVAELEDWIPYLHTITADNGKEFADHQYVAQELNIDHYFAKPYHSWERGSNENLNGLIRQYFKKSTDFSTLTDKQIKEIENKINNRPRKRFNYENPIFVMNQLLFNQKVAFVT
jgi:transposase, IS30 family